MTGDVNAIWVDPAVVYHLPEQGVNCLCICPDLPCGTLRRHDDKREIRLAFQLMRQSQRLQPLDIIAAQRTAV
jgi:hypothetical protein